MQDKTSFQSRRTILLFFVCSLLLSLQTVCGLAPQAGAEGGPKSFAKSNSVPDAKIMVDGSLSLSGDGKYQDLDFTGIDKSSCSEGPVGLKTVVFFPHLYISGESKRPIIDSREKDGWLWWYNKLAQQLGQSWKADTPGQSQIYLRVDASGTLQIIQAKGFMAGINLRSRAATQKDNPGIASQFRSGVDAALEELNRSGAARFPAGSTAQSALLMVTFTADHDLQIWIPDLSEFKNLPDDERSIRLARICTILDTAFLFDQSDRLRELLPADLRHKFIPDGAKHQFFSQSKEMKDGTYSVDNGKADTCPDLDQLSPYASRVFDEYLKMQDYAAAEQFAKALSSQVSYSEGEMGRITKVIAKHLEFLQLKELAEQLRK